MSRGAGFGTTGGGGGPVGADDVSVDNTGHTKSTATDVQTFTDDVDDALADVDTALAEKVLRTGGGVEGYAASTTVSGAKTIDLDDGNVQELTLAHNVTLTLTGATGSSACSLSLYLIQDGTGGRTVTWPASVKWPGGSAPTLTATPAARDLVVLESLNGGTTWFGSLAGLDYH